MENLSETKLANKSIIQRLIISFITPDTIIYVGKRRKIDEISN